MKRGMTSNSIFHMRQLAGMILLCALLLRGLIPSGYMPNVEPGNGQGLLTICYGKSAPVVPDVDDGQAPTDTHQQGLCAFAMLGGVVPVLALVGLLLVWLPPGLIRFQWVALAPALRRLSCAPPGARAPPSFI